MSDSGDFRASSREEKRQDETVMISSDNLSDMVSQAKTDAPSDEGSGGPNMIIIGVGVALILIVVVALVFYYMD